ncbi:MAG: hypothetical protein ACHQAY_17240 [Hyphomicrobiales bacterium]
MQDAADASKEALGQNGCVDTFIPSLSYRWRVGPGPSHGFQSGWQISERMGFPAAIIFPRVSGWGSDRLMPKFVTTALERIELAAQSGLAWLHLANPSEGMVRTNLLFAYLVFAKFIVTRL